MTWLTDIFRSLFFLLDEVIYTLVESIYGLFLEIANTTIFTDEMIESFAGKIYYLVGIFMLFKVSFSILTYIVNPDEFTDKNKGMSKLVTNIITSLIMLLAVPFVFRQAMDIQRIVLKDDIIPKFFSTEFGSGKKINIGSQDPNQGSQMAKMAFEAFYSPEGGPYTLDELFETKVNEKNDNGDYVTEYTYLISTAVGVVLGLLLISFCFDIALRSVKLGFLRLIAPVPIISRIDPKKGNEIFSKWTKTCVSTYLDIFMRLAAIFFAIYIIKALQQSMFVDAVTGGKYEPSAFTKVFIILGALMFAKQFPKLLEDILGIKLSGSFTLNPIKKIEENALGGKRLTGLAAGAAMGTMGALTGAGALQGFSGAWQGLTSNKGLSDTLKTQRDKNSKMRSAMMNGSTFGGRVRAGVSQALGTGGELAAIEREKHTLDEQAKDYDNQIKSIEDSIAPTRRQIADQKRFAEGIKNMENIAEEEIEKGETKYGATYLQHKAEYERLKASKKSSAAQIANAEAKMNTYKSQAIKDYMTDAIANNLKDKNGKAVQTGDKFKGAQATAAMYGNAVGITLDSDGNVIHKQMGTSRGEIIKLENSIYPQEQQIESIKVDKAHIGDQLRDVADRESVAKANQDAIR